MAAANGKSHVIALPTHPTLALAARVVLGCIFIVASLDKIIHPELFARTVYNYQLLPEVAVNVVALWIPWLELVGGVFLLLGFWIPGSVLLVTGLLLVFLGALGFNLARGLDVACGCFSTSSKDPVTGFTLLRDSLFLVVALYLFWFHHVRGMESRFSPAGLFRSRPQD
ncbi:MAG TPA: MauE/DoxX family redox-associated membrane protein [Syntrophobacteria bacterium]|nr:MauE/DoxX family redox-associated membrane protein [Syntrophobacteria bacterium]